LVENEAIVTSSDLRPMSKLYRDVF